MPTIVSHAVFATAMGAACRREPAPWHVWLFAATCSVLPDFDVAAFAFGVPYASVWGHRGVTHSIAFAAAAGLVAAAISRRAAPAERYWPLAAFYAAATLSHPLLDMLTNGGLGVALLAPLSNERYFAPFRPVLVSPIGAAFFGMRGARVLASEALWIWLPAGLLVAASRLLHQKREDAREERKGAERDI